LIYSDSFDALPGVVKTYVYQQLLDVASPEALEILRDTKPGFTP
jgi:hypothetical protein